MRIAEPIAVALLLLGWSGASHAYLDPGTGSMLLQGLLAGVAGAAVVLRLYWYRVKSFCQNLLSRKPPAGTSEKLSEPPPEKAES